LIYFATETPNPTPVTGALQVWGVRRQQQDRILEALGDVRFVVMTDVDDLQNTYFRDELPEVQAQLERYFHVPEAFQGQLRIDDWMLVLERGPDRGATAIDLIDPALAPRAWQRGRGGGGQPAAQPVRDLPTRHNRRPLAVHLGSGGGGLDFDLVVPEHGHFQSGVGFRAIRGRRQPNALRFRVAIGENGRFETVAEHTVLFRRNIPANRWVPLDADLSRWAGRRVTLRLEAERTRRRRGDAVALWGSPRIAVGPSPTPSG
jgi:hypothetical protein